VQKYSKVPAFYVMHFLEPEHPWYNNASVRTPVEKSFFQ